MEYKEKFITILCLIGVMYLGAACAGGAGGGGLGSNSITNAQGAAIHAGMTEQSVRQSLGKPESVSKSSSTFMGETTELDSFTYSGSGDSTWVFSFTNNHLDSKSQL